MSRQLYRLPQPVLLAISGGEGLNADWSRGLAAPLAGGTAVDYDALLSIAKRHAELQPFVALQKNTEDGGPTDNYVEFMLLGGAAGRSWAERMIRKDTVSSLYIHRPVLNAQNIIDWAKANGFETTLPPEDMHVTIAFSKEPVSWEAIGGREDILPLPEDMTGRSLAQFGEATVLRIASRELEARWRGIIDAGATWDYPEYQPHITITYGSAPDLSTIEPYSGPIVLGPEVAAPVKEEWMDDIVEKGFDPDEARDDSGKWSASGGGTVFHGSPHKDLTGASAAPPNRQFDNATSQLGAFFAPDREGAQHYAGDGGKVYEASLKLEKPYEMPISEFLHLQSPNLDKDGKTLPGEKWAARAEELKREAISLRERLEREGYDGVIISTQNGIKEISSFKDVSFSKRDGHMTDFEARSEIVKVDKSLGLVMGFAIICKLDGKPYFDTQGDHITEEAMLKSTADFMQNSRVSTHMHARDEDREPVQDGNVVFAFPLTSDIAKAFGISSRKTGLMIAMKPSADVLAKYASGEYTGFSIGGTRVPDAEEELS